MPRNWIEVQNHWNFLTVFLLLIKSEAVTIFLRVSKALPFRLYFTGPEAVQNLQVGTKAVSSIQIAWNAPASPNFEYYQVEYYPADGRQPASFQVKKGTTVATVDRLTPGQLYKFTVFTVTNLEYEFKSEPRDLCERTGI